MVLTSSRGELMEDQIVLSINDRTFIPIEIYIYIYIPNSDRVDKKNKLDGNHPRILRTILNKSWRQHPTKQQLYGHLPHITKTIKIRRTRHAGHCWRSRDEFLRDVLLWTPCRGGAKAGRPAQTYLQQLCTDTGCKTEYQPKAMGDRQAWWERVKNILSDSATWWWWWWWYMVVSVTLDFMFNTFVIPESQTLQ